MGVTIENSKYSIDMGYGGFKALRTKVAELTTPDIYKHYRELDEAFSIFDKNERKIFFDKYDAKIEELSTKYDGKYDPVLDFLYASDCSGSITSDVCEAIYDIVKDYDDDICYGYVGRPDCAMFKDFKNILKDCIENQENMEWL